MFYFDYSATTPVDDSVLDTFVKVSKNFIGNPNSLHKLGVDSKNIIEASTEQIANLVNCKKEEIIYTSGSSESNNLAIKGIAYKYKNRGCHIITSPFEHSSIYGPIGYLQKEGFQVDFAPILENGLIDIEALEKMITEETILVSIASVNSETGLKQPIEKIASLLKKYPKCFFHVDATQSIGKVNIDFKDVDLISFSAHKIYGIKGIGALIKRENISLEPLIHGGKSTTVYRSGTPAVALIASFSKALRLSLEELQQKYETVYSYNEELKKYLKQYEMIKINSNEECIPHMLNFSVLGMKPETFQHALEEYGIYISTQSACSTGGASSTIMALTNDEKRASSSVRVSLSYKTTKEEINKLKEAIDNVIKHFYKEVL